MRRHNPAFIPRNHNVEEALEAATSADDYSVMERLLDVLATPYDHERDLPMFSTPSTGFGRAALPHVLRHVVRPRRTNPGSLQCSRVPRGPSARSQKKTLADTLKICVPGIFKPPLARTLSCGPRMKPTASSTRPNRHRVHRHER